MTLTRFFFTERVRPVLEVGLGSSAVDLGSALWDVALWDVGLWNGDEPTWTDVSCDVREVTTDQGRGRVMDAFPVGKAEVTVDNTSGWADPSTDTEPAVGYFSFPGSTGNYVSVADYAGLYVAGDMGVVFRFRTATWPPPPYAEVLFRIPGQWAVLLQDNNCLQFWTVQGATITVMQSDPIVPSNDWRWFAVMFDANDGAGGHAWKWWYGGSDQDGPVWQEYSSGTGTGVITIDNAAADMEIGTNGANGFDGDISHFSYRQGTGASLAVGGTTIYEFDGWTLSDADVNSTAITPTVGSKPMVPHRTGTPPMTVVPRVEADTPLRLRPGRAIRVGVVHAELGTKWLWRGFIDSIEPVDKPDDWSTVKLSCIDALGEVGRAKLYAAEDSGAGETAYTRFGRVLDAAAWPSTKRFVHTSAITELYAAEIDGQVVDLLRQTAESEGGWCYGNNSGNVVLQPRSWLFTTQGATVDATIGNVAGPGVSFLEDPPGSGLMIYLDAPSDWVETPAASGLVEWAGVP